MGFLDRVIGGVNAAYEPWSNLTNPTDPTLVAASKRMVQGEVALGTIVGVRRRVNDQITDELIAVAATDADGQVHRFGIELALPKAAMARLRLGMHVPLRIEGKKAVLDAPVLGTALGLDLSHSGQRSKRSAPDDGVEDGAIDWSVQRRLKRWPRSTATVTGFTPVHVLGMRAENSDVHVHLADGTTAVAPRDVVPFYAASLVGPGVSVPVAVDPDGGTVAIDWPAFALALVAPSDPSTPPVPGSLAEVLTAESRAASAAHVAEDVAASTAPAGPIAPPTGTISNPSLQAWVDGVNGGWMKAKELDKGARDLVEAGMVTQEEADTARRAAGLL
jgi:hypothetical protein